MSTSSIDCERISALIEQLKTLEQDLKNVDASCQQNAAEQIASIRLRLLGLLADLLASGDEETRRAASYGLSKLEDARCVPLLVDALSDPDEAVRGWAVEGLASSRSRAALLPLVRALRDDSVYVYYSACNALKSMNRDEVWPLIEQELCARQTIVRKRAAKLVGDIRESRAVPQLIKLAEDADHGVRYEAVEALRKIGDPAAVEVLAACLQDDSHDVRIAAIQALRWMGDVRAVEPLIAICIENEDLRIPAMQALREIAGDEAVTPIIHALGKARELIESTTEEVMDAIGASSAQVVS